MNLSEFDFDVPEELIAHHPLNERDASRLLIYQNQKAYQDGLIRDLDRILPKGTLLVFNNSKVFPSRLIGHFESGGKVEIFLIEEQVHFDPLQSTTQPLTTEPQNRSKNLVTTTWKVLAKPLRKLTPGKKVIFSPIESNGSHDKGVPLVGRILEKFEDYAMIEFDCNLESLYQWVENWGIVPLPPYIKRESIIPAKDSNDLKTYQTVYAESKGSVAAPTAGLHFSKSLLAKLKNAGIRTTYLSLHVGAGTFLPVKTSDVKSHKMHFEKFHVPKEAIAAIIHNKIENLPVVAVGTTSLRSLESLYRQAIQKMGSSSDDPLNFKPHSDDFISRLGNVMMQLTDQWHQTDLFMHPNDHNDRYKPLIIDALMTNFHQPKSTLFMLVSFLLGIHEAQKLYQHAIAKKYRFFSYGDASLLWL